MQNIYRFVFFSLLLVLSTCINTLCVEQQCHWTQSDAQTKRQQPMNTKEWKKSVHSSSSVHWKRAPHTHIQCVMEYTTNEIILFLVKASLFHLARSFIRSLILIHIESLSRVLLSRFVCVFTCRLDCCYCFDDILDSAAADSVVVVAVFLFSLTQYWRAHTAQNITVKKWNH